jgi:hypothetical protein
MINFLSGGAQCIDYILADTVINLTITDKPTLLADSVAGNDIVSLQVKQELLDQLENDVLMADLAYQQDDNISKDLADMYLAAENANKMLANIANSFSPSLCFSPLLPNQLSLQMPSKLLLSQYIIFTMQVCWGFSNQFCRCHQHHYQH